MSEPTSPAAAVEERVLDVVRELAREVGGERAARTVSPTASLEREIGLGSLERVELLSRLESAFGRALGESVLRLDTVRELAEALRASEAAAPGEAAAAKREPALRPASAPLEAATTLHESLWRRAEAEPDRPTVYMREDDGRERTITYGELLRESRRIAGGLAERGVRKGDTVALMLPTGMDFLRSFQGILIAGAIPVPIYPPIRLDRLAEYARRQAGILADAGVRLLVTVRRGLALAELLRPLVPSLREVATPEEIAGAGGGWPNPSGAASDPALIQYTSGSTGAPKGVLLSHANLLANMRAIGSGLGVQPTDVGVSWLPLYHDMGLIGSWLFCTQIGIPIAIQSPLAFLARPESWLWAIHRRRGSLSAAPNFAYELCVKRVSEAAAEGLDLSSWRCALNGAEPVNPATLDRFCERFAPHGFRREALLPVYGLAENSVALCFPPLERGPRVDRVRREAFERSGQAERAADDDATALRFVSEGAPLPEHEVRILDDSGEPVPERNVGRLVFRGPSQMESYYGKPEATRAITRGDGWLDSGDLAYAAEGEIYLAGRLKDLIIKAGRNLVPQEVEEVAAAVPGIRRGCVAAFGVPDPSLGTESLVVVAETRVTAAAERDQLETAVTERVAEAVGVPPDAVVLAPPGSVAKTSSGKIRRAATRQLYESGELGRASRGALLQKLRLLGGAVRVEARRLVASGLRGLYAAYLALAIGATLLVTWPLVVLLPSRAMASLGRGFMALALRLCGCRLSVHGLQNLGGGESLLMASNHASYLDVAVLIAGLPVDFLFLAKREILTWPLIGGFVRKTRQLTVDRFEASQSVADASTIGDALEAGRSVLVFPEGTFTAADGLRPFRLGVFKTAVESGRPVLPISLRGTRRVLRDGSWVPRPGPIELWIGPPLAPQGTDWRAALELRDLTAEAIARHCGEPRLELVAGGPPRP